MQKVLILTALAAALLVQGCSSDKKPEAKRIAVDTAKPKAPMPADNELTRDYTATLGANTYTITIHRTPDKSLPTVKDALDQEFFDNSVAVTITRGGEAFFSKTFTKEAFEDYLGSADRTGSILLGMAYDEEKSSRGHLCLAAQVGQPGTGEGPALTVDIPTAGGAYSILHDTQQDTNATQPENP